MCDYTCNIFRICTVGNNEAFALISSAYDNTVQQDLWKALQTQANNESVVLPASVETIMESWTRQMGFPVITVTRLYDSNNSATATQVK